MSRVCQSLIALQADFEVSVPILVCTYTNMALDHIVEGLVARGLKPLRVGLDAKVRPALKEYVLEAYLDRHPRRRDLERLVREEAKLQEKTRLLERTIEEAKNQPKRLANVQTIMASVDRQFWIVKAKVFKLRQEMITDVLKQVDVVGSRIDHHSYFR
jgi:hypothetical protein